MADHFLGALKEIERRAQNNILVFSDVLSERLDVIAQSMISKPLSDNDYLKLAELYYKKFSKEKNKQGMLFCLLRMQQIVFLKEHTDKQTDDINWSLVKKLVPYKSFFIKKKKLLSEFIKKYISKIYFVGYIGICFIVDVICAFISHSF